MKTESTRYHKPMLLQKVTILKTTTKQN